MQLRQKRVAEFQRQPARGNIPLSAKYRTLTSTGKRSGASFPGVIAFHATGLEAVRSSFKFMKLHQAMFDGSVFLVVLGTILIPAFIWDFSRRTHEDYPLAKRNLRRLIFAMVMIILVNLYKIFIGL